MQVHFNYQHGSPNEQLERTIDQHAHKLARLLVRFSPDLIHLHGMVEFGTPRQDPACSLSLWLPTARLHCKEPGRDVPAAVRAAFNAIQEQVKKHKEVLRREGEWKRKRYKFQLEGEELQAGELRLQDRQQVRDYLDQVLPQLKSFIARELRYRRIGGMQEPVYMQEEEILDEVVARALENYSRFAADAAPFHTLLKEVVQVLNGAAVSTSATGGETSKRGVPEREELTNAQIDPVELCLAQLPSQKRQVYVLHALEGFTFEEAAQVLGRLPSEMEEVFEEVSRGVSATIQATRPAASRPEASA